MTFRDETAETTLGTSLEAGNEAGDHFVNAETTPALSAEYPQPTNPDDRYTTE